MVRAWRKRVEAATVRLPERDGQGVLVPGGFILTAAHCIDWREVSTFDGFPVAVEPRARSAFRLCVVALEPVADIAVLAPDSQAFFEDAEAFEQFRDATLPVPVGDVAAAAEPALDEPDPSFVPVHVLSHRGSWIEAGARRVGLGGAVTSLETKQGIESGTSGGPIVDEDGRLVGVVSHDVCFPGPPRALPSWLWLQIEAARQADVMAATKRRHGIDVEMRALVRAMNRPGLGMRTIDSCFGHPGEDWCHQSEAFVGFGPTDRTAMNRFWQTLWRRLGERAGLGAFTKALMPDGEWGVGFWVSREDPPGLGAFDRGHWPGGFYQVQVLPSHDPATARGREEKLFGLALLRDFCREYAR